MADDAQPLLERCGTSTQAQEARLSHTWDMTVKQAMASSNTASYSTAGRLEQINYLYKEDQVTINEAEKGSLKYMSASHTFFVIRLQGQPWRIRPMYSPTIAPTSQS